MQTSGYSLRAAGPTPDSERYSLSCSSLLNRSPTCVLSSSTPLWAFCSPARTLRHLSSCWTSRPCSGQPWRLRAKAISVSPCCLPSLTVSCRKYASPAIVETPDLLFAAGIIAAAIAAGRIIAAIVATWVDSTSTSGSEALPGVACTCQMPPNESCFQRRSSRGPNCSSSLASSFAIGSGNSQAVHPQLQSSQTSYSNWSELTWRSRHC